MYGGAIPEFAQKWQVPEIVRVCAHSTFQAEKCILSSTKTSKIAKTFASGALKNALFYTIKTPKIAIFFACGALKKDVFRSAKPTHLCV